MHALLLLLVFIVVVFFSLLLSDSSSAITKGSTKGRTKPFGLIGSTHTHTPNTHTPMLCFPSVGLFLAAAAAATRARGRHEQ